MRRYAAFALTALLLLALLGCGGGASIVGKWTDEADYGAAVIEFTRDGQVKTCLLYTSANFWRRWTPLS